MKNLLQAILIGVVSFSFYQPASAANYMAIDFSGASYSNGQLIPGTGTAAGAVGQDGWAQLGTSSTSPITIGSGYAILGPTGQDVYHGFTGGANLVTLALATVYTRFDFKIDSNASFATSTVDELIASLNFSSTVGNTSAFGSRLGIKRNGTGFQIGMQLGNGGGATYAYGSTIFNFGQDYSVINVWNRVNGTLNDTWSQMVAVNSTKSSTLLDTAFTAQFAGDQPFGSTAAEPNGVVGLNLRQGTTGPTASFSRIFVGDTLADVNVIPEPGTGSLLALGVCALVGLRASRRRSA